MKVALIILINEQKKFLKKINNFSIYLKKMKGAKAEQQISI